MGTGETDLFAGLAPTPAPTPPPEPAADDGPRADIVCAECVAFSAGIPNASIDMILTSPPYDKIRKYQGFTIDLPALGFQVERILKPGGVAVVVIQDQTMNGWKSLTSAKLQVDWTSRGVLGLFECCIYNRSGVPGAWWNRRFRVDHEYVLIFVRGRRPAFFSKEHMKKPAKWAGTMQHGAHTATDGRKVGGGRKRVADTKCPGTVWDYCPSSGEVGSPHWDLKRQHPATFPDALARDLIRCFCPEGGIVFDPFMGSGTTLAMARETGRRYLGCDISLDYCKLAAARLRRME